MNQKKKARLARGLGSDPGLDLAISRFTNSLGHRREGGRVYSNNGKKLRASLLIFVPVLFF
jgi:hypothetical protein